MDDGKWSGWKEEHIKSETKSCQQRRKTLKLERTFEESSWKPTWTHRQISQKINNGKVDIKLDKFTKEELAVELKKKKKKNKNQKTKTEKQQAS